MIHLYRIQYHGSHGVLCIAAGVTHVRESNKNMNNHKQCCVNLSWCPLYCSRGNARSRKQRELEQSQVMLCKSLNAKTNIIDMVDVKDLPLLSLSPIISHIQKKRREEGAVFFSFFIPYYFFSKLAEIFTKNDHPQHHIFDPLIILYHLHKNESSAISRANTV